MLRILDYILVAQWERPLEERSRVRFPPKQQRPQTSQQDEIKSLAAKLIAHDLTLHDPFTDLQTLFIKLEIPGEFRETVATNIEILFQAT